MNGDHNYLPNEIPIKISTKEDQINESHLIHIPCGLRSIDAEIHIEARITPYVNGGYHEPDSGGEIEDAEITVLSFKVHGKHTADIQRDTLAKAIEDRVILKH